MTKLGDTLDRFLALSRLNRITGLGIGIALLEVLVVFTGQTIRGFAEEPQATVLFDADPRTNRRYGVRNPDAVFCSGFDTECDFADCPTGYRLVWGPYCRGYDYPYIENGLYRVTLSGEGRVYAGATDYGSTKELFAFGRHEFDLPGSYTFCWPGRQEDGYGFETIVTSIDTQARIDHIKVEFLGAECE